MAFFLSRTNIGSRLHSHFQLLAEDPSLRKYKSHKKTVRRLKRVGDVLTIVVVAGCCYEIYVKTLLREEAWKAKAAGEGAS
ncbi:hypothetical protein L484_006418 [Morus notabilis]|uniref:Succinate dehydrogenase subunit 7B n=1 Tax=Morus notabilis TaxID=981085 RepID=W9QMA3_9ROSA|nr:hypothetical protein L484_006418 [Morus notabilis]